MAKKIELASQIKRIAKGDVLIFHTDSIGVEYKVTNIDEKGLIAIRTENGAIQLKAIPTESLLSGHWSLKE